MNVLFFPGWYPSKRRPLPGIFIKQHASCIKDKVSVTVISVQPDNKIFNIFRSKVVFIDDIETIEICYFLFPTRFLNFINVIQFVLASFLGYRRARKTKNFNLHHVHVLTRAGVLPYILKIVYGTPYIISEHWSRYLPERNSYNGLIRKILTKSIVRASSGVSAVSDSLKKAMEEKGLIHSFFINIPNTVNGTHFIYKDRTKTDIKFRFLHVSGLSDHIKNVSGIITAFSKVYKKQGDIELVIVGDDRARIKLEQQVRDLGLDKSVLFTGKLYGQKLIEQYQSASAFVLFSNFENQPVVVIEALLCGLPVIATRVGGISEMITTLNGKLVTVGNIEMLADEMLKIIVNINEYNNKLISENARNSYDYRVVSNSITKFYKTAITIA